MTLRPAALGAYGLRKWPFFCAYGAGKGVRAARLRDSKCDVGHEVSVHHRRQSASARRLPLHNKAHRSVWPFLANSAGVYEGVHRPFLTPEHLRVSLRTPALQRGEKELVRLRHHRAARLHFGALRILHST